MQRHEGTRRHARRGDGNMEGNRRLDGHSNRRHPRTRWERVTPEPAGVYRSPPSPREREPHCFENRSQALLRAKDANSVPRGHAGAFARTGFEISSGMPAQLRHTRDVGTEAAPSRMHGQRSCCLPQRCLPAARCSHCMSDWQRQQAETRVAKTMGAARPAGLLGWGTHTDAAQRTQPPRARSAQHPQQRRPRGVAQSRERSGRAGVCR